MIFCPRWVEGILGDPGATSRKDVIILGERFFRSEMTESLLQELKSYDVRISVNVDHEFLETVRFTEWSNSKWH